MRQTGHSVPGSGEFLRRSLFYWLLIAAFYMAEFWNDQWLQAISGDLREAWEKGYGHLMAANEDVALRFVAVLGISRATGYSLIVLWLLGLDDKSFRGRSRIIVWPVVLIIVGMLVFVLMKLYQEQGLSLRSREILLLWSARLTGILLAAGLDVLLRRRV